MIEKLKAIKLSYIIIQKYKKTDKCDKIKIINKKKY